MKKIILLCHQCPKTSCPWGYILTVWGVLVWYWGCVSCAHLKWCKSNLRCHSNLKSPLLSQFDIASKHQCNILGRKHRIQLNLGCIKSGFKQQEKDSFIALLIVKGKGSYSNISRSLLELRQLQGRTKPFIMTIAEIFSSLWILKIWASLLGSE